MRLHLLLATLAIVLGSWKGARAENGAEDPEEMKLRLDEGLEWLKENAKKEGIERTDSGLQYRVITRGEYTNKQPTANTECFIKYKGKLVDGTVVVDGLGLEEPSKFTPLQVLKGMGEALQLMRVGDYWELFLPAQLHFGKYGRTYNGVRVPGGSVLVIELMLIDVGSTPNPLDHPDNEQEPEEWEENANIFHVNDKTLKDFDKQNAHYYVFFYEQKCKMCKKAIPVITELSAVTNAVIKVAAVDCTKNFKSCGLHDITEVPTIKIYNNVLDRVDTYKGDLNDLRELWDFTNIIYGFVLKDYGLKTSGVAQWDFDFDYTHDGDVGLPAPADGELEGSCGGGGEEGEEALCTAEEPSARAPSLENMPDWWVAGSQA